MAKQAAIAQKQVAGSQKPAKAVLLDHASNEVRLAVVGYVGSGTSEIATALSGLLEQEQYDVEILKARKVIADWAVRNGYQPPTTPPNHLATTSAFQDLGDKMRSGGDHAIVARELIQQIRLTRATKLGITDPGEEAVRPDGARRAYIINSIRHPAEVELLPSGVSRLFVLVGIVCEAKVRLSELPASTVTQDKPTQKNL